MGNKTTKKYQELRTKMMEAFRHYEGSSMFYSVFKNSDNINHIILDSCCEDGKTLSPFKITPANILYQILKLAQRPIILRELNQTVPIIFKTSQSLVESFAILYSLNLVKYELRIGYNDIMNTIVLFIKEDEDFDQH